MLSLIKELCCLDGVSSAEDAVREFIRAKAEPYADWTRTDEMCIRDRCSAFGARWRSTFHLAISAKAERNITDPALSVYSGPGQTSQREGKIMYEDKTLVCKECGQEFVFTAGEQEFYAERGFQNEPQRCKSCRDARKQAARGPREYFTATCAACGGEAKVPFEPKSDRPVYCSECFARMREQG